jgi:riboflavin synthase
MFTGIVEDAGVVDAITPGPEGIRLALRTKVCGRKTRLGDSIAVNGCCLTVVSLRSLRNQGHRLEFDLLQETWKRTSFADLQPGSRVNLERALAVGARLGGHFVTGHIDGTGRIRRWEPSGKDYVLEIEVPKAMRRFLLPKGSIAIDGISLTVADVLPTGLRAWIIPHTREVTALSERKAGDRVNLEADLLGKYVDQLLAARR